ncbi:MAG: hypothetical protein ACJAZK_001122 [Psychroserpens sp.]|jgi:hypothetical protein|uniref:hypothetical protein n=1 Tax=Psychroserpens sp. TaxID=2020870 RepID=UPI0039E23112
MRTTLTINIPKPCHEDWNTMTPEKKGRHCSSCEKTVYDFTASTDEHLVKTFLDEGEICGRFKSTQLKRELVLSRNDKNNYLSFVASTLFTFLSFGTQNIEAQGKPIIAKIDTLNTTIVNGKIGISLLNERLIKGFITTKIDRLPIPGVIVVNVRSKAEIQSDFDGYYTLKVKTGDTLHMTFAGLSEYNLAINQNNNYKLELEEAPDDCGEHNIYAGVANYARLNNCLKNKERKERRKKIGNKELERTLIEKLLYNMTNIFRKKE